MGDSITNLESFAARPVRFRCKPPVLSPRAASYPEVIRRAMGTIPPPDARFETTVTHDLRKPASSGDLKVLRSMLGKHAPQFEAFYSKHDGFQLYKDPHADMTGIEAIEIKDWKKATEFMRRMVGEVPPDDDPAQVLSGVAFATALQSNNFFVMTVTGPMAGKIFYANHEDWNQNVFAESFARFLDRVIEEPISLFSSLGGSMRYSDGAGCKQWIATEKL
jgi:hypothetical protein